MTRRGVSTVVGYVISLGIMSVLITGLVLATGTYVETQREQTASAELEVIGQRLSGDLSAAARLGAAGSTTNTVTIRRNFPETVAGLRYTVELSGGPNPELTLTTDSPDIEVVVEVALTDDDTSGTHDDIEAQRSTVSGGEITVSYDGEVTLS